MTSLSRSQVGDRDTKLLVLHEGQVWSSSWTHVHFDGARYFERGTDRLFQVLLNQPPPPIKMTRRDFQDPLLRPILNVLAYERLLTLKLAPQTLEKMAESVSMEETGERLNPHDWYQEEELAEIAAPVLLFYAPAGGDYAASRGLDTEAAWRFNIEHSNFSNPPAHVTMTMPRIYERGLDWSRARHDLYLKQLLKLRGLVHADTVVKVSTHGVEYDKESMTRQLNAQRDPFFLVDIHITIPPSYLRGHMGPQMHQVALLAHRERGVELVEPHGRCYHDCWCRLGHRVLFHAGRSLLEQLQTWSTPGLHEPRSTRITQVRLQDRTAWLAPHGASCVPTLVAYVDLRVRYPDTHPLQIEVWLGFLFSDALVAWAYCRAWMTCHLGHGERQVLTTRLPWKELLSTDNL